MRAGGAGGLVLPEETAAHASETLAYSGICVRDADNSIRKGAFEGELSSGASVLRVSVQQFRAVLPSSSGAAPRAEHMARCSDHRGQGPRPGPVPRAPRGLLHPGALDGRGGRERVGRCEHRTPRPPSHARSGPALSPHRSRRSPCPHCTDPLMPQRRTRPARPLVGLTSSSAAPSAATVEVAAAAAADELVGPKRRRATTLTRLLPTYAGVNATRERARPPPPPSRPPPPPLSLPTVARRHSRHRHCCRHPRSHLRRHCRRCRA